MRQISIKELGKHLSTEMARLPFAVTKRGRVIGVMIAPGITQGTDLTLDGTDNEPKKLQKGTDKPQNVQKSVEITKKQLAETIYKNRKVTTKKATIPTDGRVYFRPNPKGGR